MFSKSLLLLVLSFLSLSSQALTIESGKELKNFDFSFEVSGKGVLKTALILREIGNDNLSHVIISYCLVDENWRKPELSFFHSVYNVFGPSTKSGVTLKELKESKNFDWSRFGGMKTKINYSSEYWIVQGIVFETEKGEIKIRNLVVNGERKDVEEFSVTEDGPPWWVIVLTVLTLVLLVTLDSILQEWTKNNFRPTYPSY